MLIGIDASRATVARRTGTETYSLHLIRHLIGLGAEHRFRLYTNGRPPAGLFRRSAPANVEVRSIPFPRLWTHLRLSVEMAVRPPDVLFVPAHVLPLIHPRRSVVTVHDLGYLHYPEAHQAADRRYLAWSTRWNARQAAAVLADSTATAADLVQAYDTDARKVRVVYLGRDEALAPVREVGVLAEVRARCGVGERYLLYVGTLQPRKNLVRVVEAFARRAARPGLLRCAVGAGRQEGLALQRPLCPGRTRGPAGTGALSGLHRRCRPARAAERRAGLCVSISLRRLRHSGAGSRSVWRAGDHE